MQFHHLGLEVRSLEESVDLYCHSFHFEIEEILSLGGERIYFLTNDGLRLELSESEDAPQMHICFEVNEFIDGLPADKEILRYENGWESCFFRNQDGLLIELLKRNEVPSD